jgi:hypothetical protein
MPASSRASVAGARQPLVESAALACCVWRCTWAAGLPGSLRCLVVSDGPWRSSTVTVRRISRCGCIRSCASLSFRVPSRSHPLARSRARAPPLGFRPSSRHEHVESSVRRASRARRCSVLSVSHALDGLLLLVPRASISLRCRVQGSRFRGLLPPGRPYHLIGGRDPRVVDAARLPVTRHRRSSRRPQGRAPSRSPRWR